MGLINPNKVTGTTATHINKPIINDSGSIVAYMSDIGLAVDSYGFKNKSNLQTGYDILIAIEEMLNELNTRLRLLEDKDLEAVNTIEWIGWSFNTNYTVGDRAQGSIGQLVVTFNNNQRETYAGPGLLPYLTISDPRISLSTSDNGKTYYFDCANAVPISFSVSYNGITPQDNVKTIIIANKDTYTVQFHDSLNNVIDIKSNLLEDSDINWPTSNPEYKNGSSLLVYTFIGWLQTISTPNVNEPSGTIKSNPFKLNKYNLNGNNLVIDLYPVYTTSNKEQLTITFNTQGGSTVSNKYVYPGGSLELPAAPTYSDHRFLGWCEKSDGSTTKYAAGSTINGITSSIVFYAIWAPIYKLRLMLNSKEEWQTINSNENNQVRIPNEKPSITGYTFINWTYVPTGDTYNVNQLITLSDNLTLVAKWEADLANYTISWNDNGATFAHAGGSTSVQQGDKVILPTTSPKKEYTITWNNNNGSGAAGGSTKATYTFKGWYTAVSGGSKVTADTVPTSNATYYAQWTAPTSITLPTTNPTRTGYSFKGWATSSNATNGNVTESSVPTNNVTYYAIWEEATVTPITPTYDYYIGEVSYDDLDKTSTYNINVPFNRTGVKPETIIAAGRYNVLVWPASWGTPIFYTDVERVSQFDPYSEDDIGFELPKGNNLICSFDYTKNSTVYVTWPN